MTFASWIALLAIVAVVLLAFIYLSTGKKRNEKCRYCPHSDSCEAKHNELRVHRGKY